MSRLAKFERGEGYAGDYDRDLARIQDRLARLQVAHHVHGHRAIIVLEGWDASGKGGIIQRLTGKWDPRFFDVHPVAAPTADERHRHFLWRFWAKLPRKGDIAVFDRSWYGRVLVERVEGFASEADWRRGYDEINAFEAQQREIGTTIIKLFVHVTQVEQDKRLRKRFDDPWKRWKLSPEDFRNRARRSDYLSAMEEMFDRTDTADTPWTLIDGNDKKAARIEALGMIADQLEANVSLTPPEAAPDLKSLAESVFRRSM